MIESLLALSVVINLIFILYSRWLISILKTSEQDLSSVSEMMQSYVTHIESVHEMEMFYGDQTLQKLIEHGNEIISENEANGATIDRQTLLLPINALYCLHSRQGNLP